VRLFGSRARGNASPDSDIDLLITVPDIWLASHDRWLTLSELRRQLAMVDVSLDLLLFSEAEVAERQHWQSHVIGQACRPCPCSVPLSPSVGAAACASAWLLL